MSRPDESRLAEWAELVGASVPDPDEDAPAAADRANGRERSG